MRRGTALRTAFVVGGAALLAGCNEARSSAAADSGSPAPIEAGRGDPGDAADASRPAGPADRLRRYRGPRVLGAPLHPGLAAEDSLHAEMRRAWAAAGENPALFELRVGERILSTGAPFDSVRAFYLPYVSQVFMDHEMEEVAGIGRQRMFTGLIEAPDGGLVKLTLTRPYFPFTASRPLDRTFIQIGTVGARPKPAQP